MGLIKGFHYRAHRAGLHEGIDVDFVFDNQMLAQILWSGHTIAEISCPTKYFPEASSINLPRSIKYGLGCLATALSFRLAKMRFLTTNLFPLQRN